MTIMSIFYRNCNFPNRDKTKNGADLSDWAEIEIFYSFSTELPFFEE